MKERLITQFLSPSVLLMAARLSSAAVTLMTQIILARTMESASLGLFFMATSAATVLAVIAGCGYPNLTNRLLARYRVGNRTQNAGTFLKTAGRNILAIAILLMIGGLLYLSIMVKPTASPVLALGLVATPLIAISMFLGAVLNAERSFLWASLPELLFRPLGLLAIVAWVLAVGAQPSAEILIATFVGLYLCIALMQLAVTIRLHPGLRQAAKAPQSQTRIWRQMAAPLLVVSLFTNLFADVAIVLSGFFLDYGVLAPLVIAIKIALLIGFFVQISHQIILPDLADALHRHEIGTIRRRLSHTNLSTIAFTLVALAFFIAFGDWMLSAFGPEYPVAHTALTILVAGQVIRALTGPAAQLLIIADRQWTVLYTTLAALAFLTISMAVLAPAYGIIGATAAIVMAHGLWCIANAVFLTRQTTIHSHNWPSTQH